MDTLTCTASPTGDAELDGARCSTVEPSVKNQDDVETCPGSATIVHFEDGKAAMPGEPEPRQPSGNAAPGTFRTQETTGKIGRTLPPVAAPPVGANDMARWAIATYWPEPPPARYLDADVATKGPWGDIVAPRDFDPFAWMPHRPWAGDWLWGMGTDPGQRILNGGQHNRYAEPIRAGDVISVTRRFVDVIERETKRDPLGRLRQRVPLGEPTGRPGPPRRADVDLLLSAL